MKNIIGKNIIAKRNSLQLTQQQLSTRSGISQPYLARLESGKIQTPNKTTLSKLGKALAVKPESLLIDHFSADYRATLLTMIPKLTDKQVRILFQVAEAFSSQVPASEGRGDYPNTL